MRKVKVALIQRCSAGSKEHNLEEITALAREAAAKCPGLDLIMFPEYNNFMPPSPQESYHYSETLDGMYITAMRALAKELGCYIDTGSFCERAGDKVKNTVVVIDRQGEIAGTYSKVHLADAMGFKESDYVCSGDQLGLVDTDFGKLGVFVCYDMRFAEMSRSLALRGAEIMAISADWPCGDRLPPRTGHWDVFTRATALHNLCHVLACNQYGEVGGEIPFGDSRVVDPWGQVIAQAGEGTRIVLAELDMDYQEKIRQRVAIPNNRRPDVYKLGEL